MSKPRSTAAKERNLVIISDLHCGCQFGLCQPGGVRLDSGGRYLPNAVQLKLWDIWLEFWRWVPTATNGQPWALVVNGDLIDGVHHGATSQVSHNLADQVRIAEAVLDWPAKHATALYVIRGTEAHDGTSGTEAERLAKTLKARRNAAGQYARGELWINVGDWLCHIAHAVGASSRQAYESSGPMGELIESWADAARWGDRPADCVVRSHRHRHIKVALATEANEALAVVTPGWQLKSPEATRWAGPRNTQPQVGGIIIRQGDREPHERHFVRGMGRERTETA